jgi:solute carrier family 25, member 33/36
MRQLPENGEVKYKGLIQCFKTVLREEGLVAMYGGMSAHLIRVIPNAAIMFFCYEAILHYGGANNIKYGGIK